MKMKDITAHAQQWERKTKDLENVRNKALVQLRYDLEKEHAFNLEKERRTWQHKHKHSLGSSQTSKAAMLKELKIDFSTKLQQLKQMHALQMEEFRCNSDQTLKKLIVKLAKYEKIFQSRREGTASSPFSNYKRSGESRETENAQLKKINGNLRQQVKLLQSSSSSLPRVHRNEEKDTPASTAEKKAEAQQQRSTLSSSSSSSSSFSSSSSVTRTTRMRHRHQSTPALVVSPPVKTPTPRRRKTKYTVEEDRSPTPSSTRSRASPSNQRRSRRSSGGKKPHIDKNQIDKNEKNNENKNKNTAATITTTSPSLETTPSFVLRASPTTTTVNKYLYIERKPLHAMFKYYATKRSMNLKRLGVNGSGKKKYLPTMFMVWPDFSKFVFDFAVVPDLVSKKKARTLFSEVLPRYSSNHGLQTSCNTSPGDYRYAAPTSPETNPGLSFKGFLVCLTKVAVCSALRGEEAGKDREEGESGESGEEGEEGTQAQIVGLLQWMERSKGKAKLGRSSMSIEPFRSTVTRHRNTPRKVGGGGE